MRRSARTAGTQPSPPTRRTPGDSPSIRGAETRVGSQWSRVGGQHVQQATVSSVGIDRLARRVAWREPEQPVKWVPECPDTELESRKLPRARREDLLRAARVGLGLDEQHISTTALGPGELLRKTLMR